MATTFCIACASAMSPESGRCDTCGAPSFSVAVRQETDLHSTLLPQRESRRRSPSRVTRLLLYGVPILALLLASSGAGWRIWSDRLERSAAYRQAEAALLAGDFDTAITRFGTAGGYDDADERRAETMALLLPYRQAYLDGLTAYEGGQYATAVAALEPVARALPEYQDVSELLASARERHDEQRLRDLDLAIDQHDWQAAEFLFAGLLADYPDDVELEARWIAYSRTRSPIVVTREDGLFIIGPDGGDERLLTDDVPASRPVWDPSRERIAFVSPVEVGEVVTARLYVINADSTDLTHVSDWLDPGIAPVWSPDGRTIAYVRWPTRPGGSLPEVSDGGGDSVDEGARQTDLFIYDLETGQEANRSSGAIGHVSSPAWSPGGDRIAVLGERPWLDPETGVLSRTRTIYVYSPVGDAQVVLDEGSLPDARQITWSPVADQLLISSHQPGIWYGPASSMIHLLDMDTGKVTMVNDGSRSVSPPIWSPDGSRFAYVEDGSVLRVRMAGMGEAWINSPSLLSGHLAWSPDGAALLATADDPGQPSLIFPLDSGAGAVPGPSQAIMLAFVLDGTLVGLPAWSGGRPVDAALVGDGGTASDVGT